MNSHYKEFSKRWNIQEIEKRAFEKFRSGVINILVKQLSQIWDSRIDSKFCELAYAKYIYGLSYKLDLSLANTELTISKSKTIDDLFFYLEVLINLIYQISKIKSIDKFLGEEPFLEDHDLFGKPLSSETAKDAYEKIIVEIKQLLSDLPLNITFSELDGKILFYPEGAKLLDEKLVNDVLKWLSNYEKAYTNFKSALEKYEKKDRPKNILDDLRSSLELFLKEYLNNEKSLENQEKFLLPKLEQEKVSPEIRNMFWRLLDFYSKYQNEYVKHDDKANDKEVEFMIYLTGNFIRFLITSKEKSS